MVSPVHREPRLDALKQQVKPRDHLPWYLPYTVNLDLMLSNNKWSYVTTYHGISRTPWTWTWCPQTTSEATWPLTMVSPVHGEPRLDALKQQVKPRDHLPWYLPYTVNLDLMLSNNKWSYVTTYHGISRTRWT